jgi:IPTL-CTERM motif
MTIAAVKLVEVPTLDGWGLFVLIGLLAEFAVAKLRRLRRSGM